MTRRCVDHTGKRFGRLTVLDKRERRPVGEQGQQCTFLLCRCDCGKQKWVAYPALLWGSTKSCGCLNEEVRPVAAQTHGMSKVPEYTIWKSMRYRCNNPNVEDYPNYGGRGITVDPRWDNFEVFLNDMGPRPTPPHSIERVDNDLGYTPDNCVWASPTTQARNRRNVRFYTYDGITLCIQDWANRTGIKYRKLLRRLNRGWNFERAISKP